MPRESKFWREIVKPSLIGVWIRIESPTGSGIPDVVGIHEGVSAWVELKDKPTWEIGLGTTRIQRYWLRRWQGNGGRAFLLARCGKEMFCLDGMTLELDGEQSIKELRGKALVWSETSFTPVQWIQVNGFLTGDCTSSA